MGGDDLAGVDLAGVEALLAEPEPPPDQVLEAARRLLGEVQRHTAPSAAVPEAGTPEYAALVDEVATRMRRISARGGVHQWRPVIATVLDVLRDVSRAGGPGPSG